MEKNDNFDINRIESGSDIKTQIRNIRQDLTTMKAGDDVEQILTSKYKSFEEKYPTLFKKIINKELEDEAMLNHMLNMLDSVKSGSTSEFNASANIGKTLYSKHIEPKVGKMKKKD